MCAKLSHVVYFPGRDIVCSWSNLRGRNSPDGEIGYHVRWNWLSLELLCTTTQGGEKDQTAIGDNTVEAAA